MTTAAHSTQQAESQAIRHFIQILLLHREQPAALMEPACVPRTGRQAIAHALQAGIAHVEGITFCLNRLLEPAPLVAALALREHPTLANVGTPAVPLTQYNQLLGGDR